MVQRVFLDGFTADIREAGQQEEADEAAAAAVAVAVEEANEAFQREKRARTRKIVKMMRKTNLAGELMTVVQSTSVIQQFQFDILTADVARKELGKRRQKYLQTRRVRARHGSDDRETTFPDEPAPAVRSALDILAELEATSDAAEAEQGREESGGFVEAGAEAPSIGVLARLADPGPQGMRAAVHRRLESLLEDGGPLTSAIHCDIPLQERRKHVLQQDADFVMRLDARYDNDPAQLFAMRLGKRSRDSIVEHVNAAEDCCLDPCFTRRVRQRRGPEAFSDQDFVDTLASVDEEDSAATIVENERQHGRARQRDNLKMKSLEQASVANYLKEWMLEHRSRNLGGEPGTPLVGPGPRERLRAAIGRAARAPAAPNERTGVGGNPKMTYVNEKAQEEASRRKARGQSFSWQEEQQFRNELAQQWDNLPEDHEDKQRIDELFEDQCRLTHYQRMAGKREVEKQLDVVSATPSSCWGIGCKAAPLAAEVLDDWRARHHRGRGLRPLAQWCCKHGMPRLASGSGRSARRLSKEQVEVIKNELSPSCSVLFGPGVCRTKDELVLRAVLDLHVKMWKWTATQWSDGLEGKFLARFVVSDGIEGASQCGFYTLSRRLGNPRRLIWTRWQAEHEAERLPCGISLQGLGKNQVFGHCLAKQLLQTLRDADAKTLRVKGARIATTDISLRSAVAEKIMENTEMLLWSGAAKRKSKVLANDALAKLAELEKPVRKRRTTSNAKKRPTKKRRTTSEASDAENAVGEKTEDELEELRHEVMAMSDDAPEYPDDHGQDGDAPDHRGDDGQDVGDAELEEEQPLLKPLLL